MSGGSPIIAPGWIVGVDIGGTFTDLVAVDVGSQTGRVTGKVLTTPNDPLEGVTNGFAYLAANGVPIDHIDRIAHATTLASNALLERKGSRVGLLTTEGHRDVIEIGREDRYDLYDLLIEVQQPLVTREHRFGIPERIGPRGEVVRQLSENAVATAAAALRERGVRSVAVGFLHSYANDAHEARAVELVRAQDPDAYVCASSEVAPMIREYERLLATVVNAYVGPVVGAYLDRLVALVRASSPGCVLEIMQSDGGLCSAADAARYPIRILESGPAAGVISAAETSRRLGCDVAVAFDMGGTTAKAALVVQGEPTVTDELEVSRVARFVAGSGLPLRVSSIDLSEVGAGGGSIARINGLRLLQIGPESAGSDPGPACFSRGGDAATVTDADVILGYVDPTTFADGKLPLDPSAARRAINVLARELSPEGERDVETAWDIQDLVNETMARAVRLHCVEHGIDPATVTLIATGGAGPIHACGVAQKVGCTRVCCPQDAGVASALGLILAPRMVERTITKLRGIAELDEAVVTHELALLEQLLRTEHHDFPPSATAIGFAHMRLRGQGHELRVRVPEHPSRESLERTFSDAYARSFGRPPGSGNLEVVNWTVRLVDRHPALGFSPAIGSGPRRTGHRPAYFGPEYGWQEATTEARTTLPFNERVAGPLLIEEAGTTTVVPPGAHASRDETGDLCIDLQP